MAVKYVPPTAARIDWVDGYPVRMRGKTYLLPPLTFLQLQMLEPVLAVTRGDTPSSPTEMRQAVATIVHAAMAAHYVEKTVDDVQALLDGASSHKAMMAILHGSGFELIEVEPGEAPAGK